MQENQTPDLSTDVSFDDVVLGFPVPQDGIYPAVITKAEMEDSKKGNAMAVITMKPTSAVKCTTFEPDGSQKEIEVTDREIFVARAVIKAGALITLKELYNATRKRWNSKKVAELATEVRNDLPTFIGRRVKVASKRRQYEGRTVAGVEHILAE